MDWQRTALVYGLVAGCGLLGAVSDAVLNRWALSGRTAWLLGAYACWIIVATLLGLLLQRQYFSFGSAVVLFLLVNSLGAVALDRFLFDGRLNTLQWAGVALALAAVTCIELGRHSHQ